MHLKELIAIILYRRILAFYTVQIIVVWFYRSIDLSMQVSPSTGRVFISYLNTKQESVAI